MTLRKGSTDVDGEAIERPPQSGAVTWRTVRSLGVVTDVVTACGLFGIGRTKAYELARSGGLPFPILTLGNQYRVPVAPLLELLGLPSDKGTGPVATSPEPTTTDVGGPRDNDNALSAV